MKYPAFGLELPIEKFFGENREPLLSKSVKLVEGQYYPFNSLIGSYLFDAFAFESQNKRKEESE